ncbi:Gfo/Idh/MocA family oxidoreductase, partial [Methylobacter tundripaludum]
MALVCRPLSPAPNRLRERFGHDEVPMYHASDFDRMVRETHADVVIVTSPDAMHHKYVIQAMELGCDVICEKPMTTDGEKLRAIFDAINRT